MDDVELFEVLAEAAIESTIGAPDPAPTRTVVSASSKVDDGVVVFDKQIQRIHDAVEERVVVDFGWIRQTAGGKNDHRTSFVVESGLEDDATDVRVELFDASDGLGPVGRWSRVRG